MLGEHKNSLWIICFQLGLFKGSADGKCSLLVEKQIRGVRMGRKKIDCFYWLNEHYNQFLRFIDLLLQKSCMFMRYLFYWSCFYSYFIDHTAHKTTYQDSKLKRPGAIPLTQFKVKVTIIWISVWLMVIDLNLNRKWS